MIWNEFSFCPLLKGNVQPFPTLALDQGPTMAGTCRVFGNKDDTRFDDERIAIADAKAQFAFYRHYVLRAGRGVGAFLVIVNLRLSKKVARLYGGICGKVACLKGTLPVSGVD